MWQIVLLILAVVVLVGIVYWFTIRDILGEKRKKK